MKILLLAALLAAPAAAVETREFSAPPPAGWSVDASTRGAAFTRPPRKDAAAATIALAYRAAVKGEPADAEAYAKSRLAPDADFGVSQGWTRAKDARVAGRACPVLERRLKSLDRHAKNRPMMAETMVVVPAAGGYYLLTLHGPEAARAKDRKAFQRVLDGFKPAL